MRSGEAGPGTNTGRCNLLVRTLVALLLAWSAPAGAASQVEEYELKAAFLYQFTRYVSWPEGDAGPVAICVLGEDPFGPSLDATVADKTARGKPIVVRRIRSAGEGASCQILFVSRSERPRLDATLAALGRRPTLTVADMSGFPSEGGMINLRVEEERIKLEINPDNAERAGLKIRSELLRLADVVRN